MRTCSIVVFTFCAAVVAVAQLSNPQLAVKTLAKLHPEVQWDSRSATSADVNCDLKNETIVLGKRRGEVFVALVSGKHHDKTRLLSFPIGAAAQDSFCAPPVRIEVLPLDCEPDIGHLPGCTPVRGCKSFRVVDDECDSFNFYWDSARKTLGWWRH